MALEYLFARRSAAPNQPKDVAHIWELGEFLETPTLLTRGLTTPIGDPCRWRVEAEKSGERACDAREYHEQRGGDHRGFVEGVL